MHNCISCSLSEIAFKTRCCPFCSSRLENTPIKNTELSNTEKNIDTIIKNINNSLSIVIGFTDLLINKSKSGEIDLEFIHEKLPIIMESARKIDMILHDHKYKSLKKISKNNN